MRHWYSLGGRMGFLVAAFAVCYLGAMLGGLGTREVRASHNFADVPTGAFYHAFVDYLAQSGVTAGCGAGLYCPEQTVTRGQLAVFLGQIRLLAGCPPDSARVGAACVDRYEASVWETSDAALIQKIRLGIVTHADLTSAGAIPRGGAADDYPASCQDTGAGCTNLYAVSIAGVTPSAHMTWFQAAAFARNAGKRLPTNQEWQVAALGTPDHPGPCNTITQAVGVTGTSGCVSDAGVSDQVGNLWEWVDTWVPAADGSAPGWGGFSDDLMFLSGADTTEGPGALLRGGDYLSGTFAGPYAVSSDIRPTAADPRYGFRGAR